MSPPKIQAEQVPTVVVQEKVISFFPHFVVKGKDIPGQELTSAA